MTYEAPQVRDLGTLAELTQTNFNKNPGSSDTITIGNNTVPAPGSGIAP